MVKTKSRAAINSQKAIFVAVAAVAIIGTTISAGHVANGAELESSSATAEINVTVDGALIQITKINDVDINSANDLQAMAVKTLSAKNKIHFKVDRKAHIKIVLKDKVLWEGDAEPGQPIVAEINLPEGSIGLSNLSIRATVPGDSDYTQTFFTLDYRATIPSIIPGGDVAAPNTGLYMTIGGHVYSMTTVAFILILTAVTIYLLATRYSKKDPEAAQAKSRVKAKKSHEKMDLV